MRNRVVYIMSIFMIFLIVSCGREEKKTPSPVEPQAKGKNVKNVANQLYIEVSALGSLDYFYDHKLGMELAGKILGVRTEYVGPADYDMAAMISVFEQTIARKPNGIVVVGFEPSLDGIVDKAAAAGIPVVTVDADLPDSKRIAFVGTGNYQAGYQGGTKLADLIAGKGRVALMT
ncbi:substrate-binding domain-containing protein, partial [Candidatus Sumerlaeota bacterium]|nr:substrate-binding domain-containing protein [Candidatus Sumerlaeota bacterium]